MNLSQTLTPPRSPSRLARPVLGLVVLLQAAGLVLTTARDGTSLGAWMFGVLGWSEAFYQPLERAGVGLAVLASLLAVFSRRPNVRLAAAGVASACYLALALGEWRVAGAPYTEVALPAHATRIIAPLLLALWARRTALVWLLRGSIALTFAIHGVEAIDLHPRFIDYLLSADQRLLGLGLQQSGAEVLLRLIGIHDVLLAGLVLLGRDSRRVLGWMAFWGAVTALSRVVQGGSEATHHALIRAANAGLPLVLLFLSERKSMRINSLRLGGRLARVALPLALLVLPFIASAQALSGANPGHLRVLWTEDPAHRASISWSTSAAGSTHEVYLDTQPRGGNPQAYARKVAARNGAVGGVFFHHANVTGLEPSTPYYFVVVSDGKASPERHFISAPVDDRPFRLLSGGDSRSGLAERKKMNQLMARLVEQDPGIIALVHGGDYINTANSWPEWNDWLSDHALTFTASGRVLPVIPTRGNHEGNGVMYNVLFDNPGGSRGNYYTAQLGANTRIIVLDTHSSIGGNQARWLEQALREAQAGRWILPCYHRPAFPAVKTPSEARQFWVPLFEKYNVDLVLESDGHVLKRTLPIRNEKYDATGIVYVGEGGLGVSQRTPSNQWYLKAPGMAKSAHHVQVLSFTPEALVYEARGMTGTLEDSYTAQPRRAGAVVAPPAASAPAITSVSARTDRQVAVTFSTDMERATTAMPGAYKVTALQPNEPSVQLLDVAEESPRTYVLATSRLTQGAEYTLSITGVRSAQGGTAAWPVEATFTVPVEQGGTHPPAPTDPSAPAPEPQPTPPAEPQQPAVEPVEETPVEQTPVEEEPLAAAGCTAAAGGSLLWAGAAVAGLVARRRRRSARAELR